MLWKDANGHIFRQKMYCFLDEETSIVVAYTFEELEEKFGPMTKA